MTAIGQSVLTGLVAVHVYVFTTEPSLPGYFAVYSAVLITGCVIAAGAMLLGRKAAVAQAGWYLGSLVCLGFLATYLVSRWFTRPGLEALTGRWDFASGTLAMAFAGAFIAVHATILSGINVAHPRQRDWRD
nr:oxidoreductase [Mycobacterium sp. 852002-40037_SCH5390672]